MTYILTPCTWVWLIACIEAEQWNINVKTPMCQTRNGYLHNEAKAESTLFSEVVQRYSGDEKVICWLAPLTKFIQSVQAHNQRLKPFLYFTADRNSSDSILIIFKQFLKKKIKTKLVSSAVRTVVLKQMKSPMNGFVLHVNNSLENQFSTKKSSLDCGQVIFLQQSIL